MIVDVSPAFFAKHHGGLVKMLQTIRDRQRIKSRGLNTREACEFAFNSANYGMQMLYEAEREGLIRRVKVNNHHEIRNILTPKAIQLLQALEREDKEK
jgi:hypothetical protein